MTKHFEMQIKELLEWLNTQATFKLYFFQKGVISENQCLNSCDDDM